MNSLLSRIILVALMLSIGLIVSDIYKMEREISFAEHCLKYENSKLEKALIETKDHWAANGWELNKVHEELEYNKTSDIVERNTALNKAIVILTSHSSDGLDKFQIVRDGCNENTMFGVFLNPVFPSAYYKSVISNNEWIWEGCCKFKLPTRDSFQVESNYYVYNSFEIKWDTLVVERRLDTPHYKL